MMVFPPETNSFWAPPIKQTTSTSDELDQRVILILVTDVGDKF